jgi:hypothetical protein
MTRELYDTLFDNIVSRLETAATAEVGADATLGFEVLPDNIRSIGEATYPAWVLPRVDNLSFETDTSAVAQDFGVTASYAIDCIVRTGKTSQRAGRVAGARLRYLVTQVIRALWVRTDWDLGMTENIHRAQPRTNWVPPEIQTGQQAVIGATVTLEAGLTWSLVEPTGPSIDSIDVDVPGWFAALYEYGE